MKETECVQMLQWALPRLGMRWAGFRRVRAQVCKRIHRRMRELGLADVDAYRALLERDAGEWKVLDSYCRITISRFCRERAVFCKLAESVLPALAATAGDRLRVWSAGCGSGEEPYSVSLLWQLKLRQLLAQCRLEIVATDASEVMLRRAMQACYGDGSLRELPTQWRRRAFQTTPTGWCLRPEFRAPVELRLSDIRDESPAGPFQLVLCRYLAFTYFDRNLQQRMLGRIRECLARDGALVVGSHEALPPCADPDFQQWLPETPIYRYTDGQGKKQVR